MRYSEDSRIPHQENARQENDFQPRRRIPTVLQLALVVGISFVFLMAAHLWSGSAIAFAIIAVAVLAFVNGMILWDNQRFRDQVLASEFQNALFSSAIRVNTLFCLIVHRDGTIAYSSDSFSRLFPRFSHANDRHIDVFFEQAGLSQPDIDRIYNALTGDEPAQIFSTLKDGEGLRHKLVITLDPLRRPREFAILRARQFIEERKDDKHAV